MLMVNIARVVSLLAVILWGLIVLVAAVFREFRESNYLLPWLIVSRTSEARGYSLSVRADLTVSQPGSH